MEFKIEKSAFMQGLYFAQGIADRKSTMPILANVLLKAGDGRVDLRATDLDTIVGHVNFRTGPVPSVSKTPLVGGQWQKKGSALELVIVENGLATSVPIGGALKPIA